MSNEIKKSRRAIHNYSFEDKTVNLNGYSATCTVTGTSKKFYHSYLANLITKKYANNFAHFEDTYVSREGKGLDRAVDQVAKIEAQINRYQSRIDELRSKLNTL